MHYTNTQIIAALRKAISEIFEGMSFAEVNNFREIEFPLQFSSNSYFATIEMLNPFNGEFYLICTRNCSINVLGASFDEAQLSNSDQIIADLISEYSNAIAGCFLRHLIPPDQTFEISLPRFGTIQDQGNSLQEKNTKVGISFQVDNHPLHCVVSF